MLLTELESLLLDLSGQYLVGSIEDIYFDHDRVWRLAKRSLDYYQKYKPVITKHRFTTPNTQHVFDTENPPDWVSRCIPIGIPLMTGISVGPPKPSLHVPNFIWRYESPTLYVSESTGVECECCYPYEFTVTRDADNKIEQVDIPGIDEGDDKFFDLTLAQFLIAIGRSRRAFTINDLTIAMDGGDLISEGTELFSSAKESLGERSKWYLAVKI